MHEDPTVDLQMRDRELTEIAKSIASLAELFKDLSVLVIDQGTLLDSVEYNIEQTAVHVSEAVKELDTATRYFYFPLLSILLSQFAIDIKRTRDGGNAFSYLYSLSSD